MAIQFSERPGPRERQLRRRYNNPLFVDAGSVTQASVDAAREQDRDEAAAFFAEFRRLVQQAESGVILSLKERLDKAYEQASGLGEGQQEIKVAIRKLLAAIMQAAWKGAGEDQMARRQLDQEERARATHFSLLEEPLVADILNPESPVGPDELVPTLLSESADTLETVLEVFDEAQLGLLCRDARDLLDRVRAREVQLAEAEARLHLMQRTLASRPSGAIN